MTKAETQAIDAAWDQWRVKYGEYKDATAYAIAYTAFVAGFLASQDRASFHRQDRQRDDDPKQNAPDPQRRLPKRAHDEGDQRANQKQDRDAE